MFLWINDHGSLKNAVIHRCHQSGEWFAIMNNADKQMRKFDDVFFLLRWISIIYHNVTRIDKVTSNVDTLSDWMLKFVEISVETVLLIRYFYAKTFSTRLLKIRFMVIEWMDEYPITAQIIGRGRRPE